jgi:hypothetical protein
MEKGRKYWNPIVQNSHFSFLFFIFQLCCLLFIFSYIPQLESTSFPPFGKKKRVCSSVVIC